MRPHEQALDDPATRARRLVAEFTTNGADALAGMSPAERRLLLAEKQAHLDQVTERCAKGEGLHVNVPLKRILEAHVREIGRPARSRRDIDMEL
jgi:hypothetical protein